jgi:hypothetical protein
MSHEMRSRQHRVSGGHRRNNGVYGTRGNHAAKPGCFPIILIMIVLPIVIVAGGLYALKG